MQKFNTRTCVLVALMGGFLIADTAEAQQTRSVADRRQRPGLGYWAKPSQSSSYNNRSYNNNSRNNWSFSGNNQRYSAPRTYTQPSSTVVRSQPSVIHRSYPTPGTIVQPQTVVSRPGTVIHSQPTTVIPNSGRVIHTVPPSHVVGSPGVYPLGVVQQSPVVAPPVNSQPSPKATTTTQAPTNEKR